LRGTGIAIVSAVTVGGALRRRLGVSACAVVVAGCAIHHTTPNALTHAILRTSERIGLNRAAAACRSTQVRAILVTFTLGRRLGVEILASTIIIAARDTIATAVRCLLADPFIRTSVALSVVLSVAAVLRIHVGTVTARVAERTVPHIPVTTFTTEAVITRT